jgi:hypothetical protein
MLRSQPKSGFKKAQLVVPSEEVDLNGEIYQTLKTVERSWRHVDHYSNPGPIQYYDFGNNDMNETLKTIYKDRTSITQDITGLCRAISNDVMFAEHSHLLLACLSSLESAKKVLNSLDERNRLGTCSAGH